MKKNRKGIKGFHAWQMRWFELTKVKLAYWEVSMRGGRGEGLRARGPDVGGSMSRMVSGSTSC